jgi:hypothetical protein
MEYRAHACAYLSIFPVLPPSVNSSLHAVSDLAIPVLLQFRFSSVQFCMHSLLLGGSRSLVNQSALA